ncbi:MAG: M23 family metallopeptidase [Oscillospiraceae bacterium]|nr:M23 family metallopeptidase [Oscillospiraceae bacterium]
MRLTYPIQTKAFLGEHISSGINYMDALGVIGGSLRSFLVSAEQEQEEKQSDPPPSEPQATPEEAIVEAPAAPAGVGYILWMNWEYLSSTEDETDDTEPVPFGLEKPARVDYGVYPVSFKTTEPLPGDVTSAFGYRIHPVLREMRFHYGIDINGSRGDAIRAWAAGEVSVTGESSSYGKYIIIRHQEGYSTLYSHCSKIFAAQGEKISRGQAVAAVGSTGMTTGPHLHFELRKGRKILNPLYYRKNDSQTA